MGWIDEQFFRQIPYLSESLPMGAGITAGQIVPSRAAVIQKERVAGENPVWQNQADGIVRQIRDLKTSGDYIDLKVNTPLVIAGDFNVFYQEDAPHLTTILTGNISSEDLYGADEKPDWDMSNLTDVRPTPPSYAGITRQCPWRDARP